MNKKGQAATITLTAALVATLGWIALAIFGFGATLGVFGSVFSNLKVVAIIVALILGGFIIFRIFKK